MPKSGTPKHRKKIDWKPITDLPVQSRNDAIGLQWYAMMWRIEVFHKILKIALSKTKTHLGEAARALSDKNCPTRRLP